jgi:class 3 adenylate cyclase
VITASVICVLAIGWVLTYLALDRPLSAAIPLGYQLATIAGLWWFRRTCEFGVFRVSQIALILVLPFLLQWSLGGFVNGSAVMVWAFAAPLGAAVFFGARAAVATFAAFAALTLVSGLLDPTLAAGAPPLPEPVRRLFFVLNVLGMALATFLVVVWFVHALGREQRRSEGLLRNILPAPVADRLKRGEHPIADRIAQATVLFADIVDFTALSVRLAPDALIDLLDRVFRACDELAEKHGLEKIKTVGDSYMAAAGVPLADPDHARSAAEMALDLEPAVQAAVAGLAPPIRLRVGLHSGSVVAGVIGRRKFAYDLWGPAVNIASRMESQGVADRVQVSNATYRLLSERYLFEPRGRVEIKGLGEMETWLLVGRR